MIEVKDKEELSKIEIPSIVDLIIDEQKLERRRPVTIEKEPLYPQGEEAEAYWDYQAFCMDEFKELDHYLPGKKKPWHGRDITGL